MNRESELFREESMECIRKIAEQARKGQLEHAELIDGGLFNTTYRLDFCGGERAILRLGPVNPHLLMPFEKRMIAAEASVYELVSAHGIPTQNVLCHDESHRLIDRDYNIVEYIDAVAMSAIPDEDEDKKRLRREVGTMARKLHAVQGPGFGRAVNVFTGKSYGRWSDALRGEIEDWKTVGMPAGFLQADEIHRIERVMEAAAPILDEIRTPFLAHADLWEGNILVSPTKPTQVLAIIDMDRVFFGDPMFDMAQNYMPSEEFMEGYGAKPSDCAGDKVRKTIYRMISNLCDGYVWKIQYHRPESGEHCHDKVLMLLRELEEII